MEATYTSQEVYLFLRQQMIFSIGPSLGILFAGGLLTLGIICIFLLSPEGKDPSKQQRSLQIYVVVVVLIVLGYQCLAFLLVNYPAFTISQPLHEQQDTRYILKIMINLLPVIVGGLTDGLLVWRCFMVQRALGPNGTKFRAAFWILPMTLWSTTIGFTGEGLICFRRCSTSPWCIKWISVLQSIAITSNVILNLFATSYIVIRLLLHRRALIACYGREVSTVQHLCIAGILLESAAINVPVTIILVVSINKYVKTTVTPLAVACQAFASVLIIHQVAIGEAFRQREACDMEKPQQRKDSDQSLDLERADLTA